MAGSFIVLMALGVLALVLLGLVLRDVMVSRVSRARLERFARRQALDVTPGNGDLVIRYLAVTRRWRTLGLVVAFLAGVAWSLRDSKVTANFLAMFLGWFAGAVVAEWRLAAGPRGGPRRAAVLTPRRLADHLGAVPRGLVAGLAVVCAVLAGIGLVGALAGSRAVDRSDLGLGVLGAALAVGVPAAVARDVLDRAQPAGLAPDVLAADDAVRDRSIAVLAGCAVAFLGWPVALLLVAAGDAAGVAVTPALLALVAVVVLPLLGWLVATVPQRVRRPVVVA